MNAHVLAIGMQAGNTQASNSSAKTNKNYMPDFAKALSAEQASSKSDASAVTPGAPSSQEAQTQQPGKIEDSNEMKPEDEGVIFYPAMLSMLLPLLTPQAPEVTNPETQSRDAAIAQLASAQPDGVAMEGGSGIFETLPEVADEAVATMPEFGRGDNPVREQGTSYAEGQQNVGEIATPVQRAAQDKPSAGFSSGNKEGEQSNFAQAFPMTGAMLADSRVVVAAEPNAVEAPATSVPVQIVDSIQMAVSEGRQECEIQLQPEHLGRLVVKLVMTEGGLSARIDAADSSVRAMLNGQLSDLRDALSQRGIRVAELDVTYQAQMQTNAQPNFANQNQGSARQERPNYLRITNETEGMEAPAASLPNIGQDLDAPGVVVNA